MYEVTISQRTASVDKFDVQQFVIGKLNADLGRNFLDRIDHLMMFMPSNVGEFGAYAEFPGKLSVYDGYRASYGSVYFVHEIGHNLRLDHSGQNGDEYGDVTCSMGYGIDSDDHRVCYNPPKSWALGWYDDKHVTLDLDAGAVEEFSLVGVAEYDVAGTNDLFVRLVNGRGDDYYIGFNRAIGINADQSKAVDQVTVTKSGGSDQFSFLVAMLGAGATYEISTMKIDIEVLSINVSSTPGVAEIRITSRARGGGGAGVGGVSCFSGENVVSVLAKGDIRLESLEIGDYVRSSSELGDGTYSRVYGFLHLQRQLSTEYLKFTFGKENALDLEVSPKHLLYSKGRTIAAGHVKVGDVLDGKDGETLLVIGIAIVQRDGVYAPATESGDIVVSGVRASNYVNLLDTSAIDQHTMSHAFLAPMRFVCTLHFDWCQQETYTEQEGYSHWVKYFVWISDILNPLGYAVQYLTTLLVSPIVALLTVCDLVVSGRGFVAAGLSLAMASAYSRRRLFR
jgi:Hint module/Gametolysin peptidase M11